VLVGRSTSPFGPAEAARPGSDQAVAGQRKSDSATPIPGSFGEPGAALEASGGASSLPVPYPTFVRE